MIEPAVRAGVLVVMGWLAATPTVRAGGAPPETAGIYGRFAVAADHPVASAAGAAMLRAGGNAIDAAVATSFCLSVVRPESCGIGGGGFMIVHVPARGGRAAQTTALDYRECAPRAVGPSYYVDLGIEHASRFGVHAVAVPGTVAGLLEAHARWGVLDRRTVLAPAIRAAREGFVADAHHVHAVKDVRTALDDHPELRDDADFVWTRLCGSGAIAVGDRIANPEQARTLERLAADGAEAFYRGAIADELVAFVAARGGPLSPEDLAAYRPRERTPLRGGYRDFEIVTMPPPSSGGIASLQVYGLLERLEARDDAIAGPVVRRHLLAESCKHAFADRARGLADPDFAPVPVAALLDPAALDAVAARIDPGGTDPDHAAYGTLADRAAAPIEDGGTSHFCVVDADGMAVACTETINLAFGSLVAVPSLGFVLNDEMDDFTTIPGAANAFGLRQSDANLPHPGQRPLSSMTPTIALRADGRVAWIAGASGGPRIITGTLQATVHRLRDGMTAWDAVAAPRLHHQWLPNVLQFEDAWIDEAAIAALGAMGHATGRRADVGNVQAIAVNADGTIEAACDPRKCGRPDGE